MSESERERERERERVHACIMCNCVGIGSTLSQSRRQLSDKDIGTGRLIFVADY